MANHLNGGEKAEWLGKGYDNFTDEEKEAFSTMHSKHDKYSLQSRRNVRKLKHLHLYRNLYVG